MVVTTFLFLFVPAVAALAQSPVLRIDLGGMESNTTLIEGAENGLSAVTVQPSSEIYNPITHTIYADPPARSFHLVTLADASAQSVLLNTPVVAHDESTLNFHGWLRQTGPGQIAHVQISTDNGVSWPIETELFTKAGDWGVGEARFSENSYSLAAFAGQSIRIRFLLSFDWSLGGGPLSPNETVGWFIQQIQVKTGGQLVISVGAENPSDFTIQKPPLYDIVSLVVTPESTRHSFHLVTLGDSGPQWVLLNTPVIPQVGSTLRFKSWLRQTGPGQIAHAQVSTSTALVPPENSWTDVFAKAGDWGSGEAAFSQKSYSLDNFAGQSIRIRFLLSFDWALGGGPLSPLETCGWFIDLIEVTSVQLGGRDTLTLTLSGGVPGDAYVLQRSEDLESWSDIAVFSGSGTFVDRRVSSRQFYRVVTGAPSK